MRTRAYGQFCGLARAAEMLGQRWTLLILRDLLVGPRRYSDLLADLPGIPTNLLATRLKELEHDGLVTREVRRGADRSIVYAVTERGTELAPALDALARWGAAAMHTPREGEIVTDTSLATALRAAADSGTSPERRHPAYPEYPAYTEPMAYTEHVTYTVRVGNAVAHAIMRDGMVEVAPGEHPAPDLVVVGGTGFRDLLAGTLDPEAAIMEGAVEVEGDPALLALFAATFTVPYTTAADA